MSFNVAGSNLLTVEKVRGFNDEELNGFLKRRLNNIDNEIDALAAEKVDGAGQELKRRFDEISFKMDGMNRELKRELKRIHFAADAWYSAI
ncbi:17016_t:CDS:2, partial [Acaulospora colombiana]